MSIFKSLLSTIIMLSFILTPTAVGETVNPVVFNVTNGSTVLCTATGSLSLSGDYAYATTTCRRPSDVRVQIGGSYRFVNGEEGGTNAGNQEDSLGTVTASVEKPFNTGWTYISGYHVADHNNGHGFGYSFLNMVTG